MKPFSIGKEKALKMYESKWWEGWDDKDIVMVQLFTAELCMPFDKFHGAVERTLGRPVWTHEFGFWEHLVKEFLGEKEPPSLSDILNLIPAEKCVVVTP